MNNEPTDQQINRKIAEWRGNNVIVVLSNCIVMDSPGGGKLTKPLLTKSHDAIAKVLDRMTKEMPWIAHNQAQKELFTKEQGITTWTEVVEPLP